MSAPLPNIDAMIVRLRGHNVLLDEDLAELYGVPVKRMNQQVRRNAARFPVDFMFQLTSEEIRNLRSRIVTSSATASIAEDVASKSQMATAKGHGGRRFLPYAFTEQGVAMLSSVLRSPRAVAANIEIMRTFVRLRRMLESNHDLARKLATLERTYDARFRVVFDAIRGLMTPPAPVRKRIGFRAP